MAKQKFIRVTTPVGAAVYPHLHAPDYKWKSEGEWQTKIRWSPDVIDALRKRVQKVAEDYRKKESESNKKVAKYKIVSPFKEAEDDEGEPTGEIEAKVKQQYKIEPKNGKPFKKKVKLFDATGKPCDGVKPWSGTQLAASVDLIPYASPKDKEVGVSLRLNAIQIIELVTQDGGSAEDYGFETNEDGYSFSEDDVADNADEDDLDDDDETDSSDDEEEGDEDDDDLPF